MCRRSTTTAISACTLVLFGLLSSAYGVDGSGSVYVPNSIEDPSLHAVTLTHLDGSGYLRGDAADVTNSLTDRAYAGTLAFNYDPASLLVEDRTHFAETMAYYHMTDYYNYVRNLGFNQVNFPVSTVVFAARCPYYTWIPIPSTYDSTTRTVYLAATSDLNYSDAYDADVVVHEYAHVVQHALRGGVPGPYVSPLTTSTEQGQALMEALADFAATSRFNNPRRAEWAATISNGRPFLRNVDNFYRWPTHFAENNAYRTGMIFSGAMWDLRSVVGRTVSDTLALELVRRIPDNDLTTSVLNTTLADAVAALLQADTDLYAGAHRDLISQAFAVHGLGDYDFSTLLPMVRNPGNNYDETQVFSLPGATELAVKFDDFVTRLDDSMFAVDEAPRPVLDAKSTVDWLFLLDGNGTEIGRFTGRQLQGATITVPGDTVQFHLVTDALRESFGYRVVDISAVPEPATLALLALGSLTLLRSGRRRRG